MAALRKKGVTVEYIVFEDEGHGIRCKENQARAYAATVAFLDKYLKGNPGAPSAAADDVSRSQARAEASV